MTHPLIIRPEAEEDMAEGRDWYDGQRQGQGAEFLTAVDEVFDRIRETPELYAPEYKSVRRVGLHRFPYVVYYRLVGSVASRSEFSPLRPGRLTSPGSVGACPCRSLRLRREEPAGSERAALRPRMLSPFLRLNARLPSHFTHEIHSPPLRTRPTSDFAPTRLRACAPTKPSFIGAQRHNRPGGA
jgi:toxin ParE1/3/4